MSRTLTDEDIKAISEAMKFPSTDVTLSADEVVTLKRFLRAFDKAAGIVGKIVLTSAVVTLIAIFTKGFWLHLASSIKQGSGK